MHSDELPIPAPCRADWNAMAGAGERRFCSQCREHVHDLSTMTEAEARVLLDGPTTPCVRYTIDADGGIRFAPSVPASIVPISALRRRPVTPLPAAALVVALAACAPHGERPQPQRATASFPELARTLVTNAEREHEPVTLMGIVAPDEPCDPPKPPPIRPRMGRPVRR